MTCPLSFAQTETATVSGLITDETGAVVPGAEVKLQSVDRGTVTTATTNDAGIYVFASVHPGQYQVTVHKPGFKQVDLLGMIVNVQDHIEQNFRLQVGSVAESVTVNASDLHIDTTDATVSTVVDRQFAENLPLNGRSFQTLIELTPGVVLTASSFGAPGQFSVNGQRDSSNYFMVDGVSANVGINFGLTFNQNASGSVPAFNALGGTNNLVSVDAMQEFRIQTSTYAPEFGRTPGAQISIVTRSGTNQFHGTAFEYLRNDVLDANDWFAGQKGLRKAEERQNDFGGVFGGPIIRDRTFFFLSYEGQRLRLPQTAITTVPSISVRQSAPAAVQPFLNAYPLPNGPEILDSNGNPTGKAPFNATYSDQASLNAGSIRIDHRLKDKLTLFGRYSHAPSELLIRRPTGSFSAVSSLQSTRITTQTLTLGTTWVPAATATNDFRFNYSRTRGSGTLRLDTFGGAVTPPDSILFPNPHSSHDSEFALRVIGLQGGFVSLGRLADNLQRQVNVQDGLSLQLGQHTVKVGFDYRHLFPEFVPNSYVLEPIFSSVQSLVAQNPLFVFLESNRNGELVFKNLSLFAQDTWKVRRRMTLTYGLRWDIDFAPSTNGGPSLLAVTGFDNPSSLALAPAGTPIFHTKYHKFAPRIGLAYQLSQTRGRETVLRGGFGMFYDLSTQAVGEAIEAGVFPFGGSQRRFGVKYPSDPALFPPPPISVSSLQSTGQLLAFNPDLELPYTLQWNFALQQALGERQSVSVSYVGAAGRRLLQTEVLFTNPSFAQVNLVGNFATSDYHSMQFQYQRRVSHGLQVVASYVLAHSIDTASSSSSFASGSLFVPGIGANANRGPSDFDVRHSMSAGITYNVPSPRGNLLMRTILENWSVDSVVVARSAPPVEVFDGSIFFADFNGDVRPDLVSGQPLYLKNSGVAGGKQINSAAFMDPPLDPNTGFAARQGTLGRNALRGFGATQWDFAVRRQFKLVESLNLQFRTEFFNLLNHPNFGNPVGDLSGSLFGQSIQMLGRSLTSQNAGLSPLYQIGGPRSIQFALKLLF